MNGREFQALDLDIANLVRFLARRVRNHWWISLITRFLRLLSSKLMGDAMTEMKPIICGMMDL